MYKLRAMTVFLVVILAYTIVPPHSVAAAAPEATLVGGRIRRDTVWSQENNPYVLEDDLIIPAGVRLTIEEGVKVNLTLWSIIVEGELRAEGAPDNKISFHITMPPLKDNKKARIYFTPESRAYRENNQGCMIEHARIICADYSISYGVIHANRLKLDDVEIIGGLSHWKEYAVKTNGTITNCLFDGLYRGIMMKEGTIAYNRFLNTRYASAINIGNGEVKNNLIDGGRGGIKVKNALVKGNTIINQAGSGIHVNNYGAPYVTGKLSPILTQNTIMKCEKAVILSGEIKPIIVNNVFTDNMYGVCFEVDAFYNDVKPKIEYNVFYGNEYDVYSYKEDPRIEVNLDNNWWGTTDPAVIDEKIFDVNDNPRLCSVIYAPILNEPPRSLPKVSYQLTVNEPTSIVEILSSVDITGKIIPPLTVLSIHVTCNGPDGARVEKKAITDSDGEFSLQFTPTSVGVWGFTVAPEENGLVEANLVEVQVYVTKIKSEIDLSYSPKICFEGAGVTVNGLLIPGMYNEKVEASFLCPDGSENRETALTDSGGAFMYKPNDAQPGVYTVTLTWPGTSEYQGVTETLVYRVHSPSTLNMVIMDESGSPVQNAAVASTTQPEGQISLSGVTNPQGALTFDKILSGSYTFQVEKQNYEPSTVSLNVPEGESTHIQYAIKNRAENPSTGSPASSDGSGSEGDPWYMGFVPSALTFVVLITLYVVLHRLRR
ncbi:MAG: carboxypeptidase regulatory-like domain-containing protein [Candidatus Bathyarchaeota archaeon]